MDWRNEQRRSEKKEVVKVNEKGRSSLYIRVVKVFLGIYPQRTKNIEIEKTRRRPTREVFRKNTEIGGERGKMIVVAEKNTIRQGEKLTILVTVPDQGWVRITLMSISACVLKIHCSMKL